jgi:hypothetical protein
VNRERRSSSPPANLRRAGDLAEVGGVAVEGAEALDHRRVELVGQGGPVVVEEGGGEAEALRVADGEGGAVLLAVGARGDQRVVEVAQRGGGAGGSLPDGEGEGEAGLLEPLAAEVEAVRESGEEAGAECDVADEEGRARAAREGSSRAWSNQKVSGRTPQRMCRRILRSTTEVDEAVGIATRRPASSVGGRSETKRILCTGPREPMTRSGRIR